MARFTEAAGAGEMAEPAVDPEPEAGQGSLTPPWLVRVPLGQRPPDPLRPERYDPMRRSAGRQ